jgi:hypothetical protein
MWVTATNIWYSDCSAGRNNRRRAAGHQTAGLSHEALIQMQKLSVCFTFSVLVRALIRRASAGPERRRTPKRSVFKQKQDDG